MHFPHSLSAINANWRQGTSLSSFLQGRLYTSWGALFVSVCALTHTHTPVPSVYTYMCKISSLGLKNVPECIKMNLKTWSQSASSDNLSFMSNCQFIDLIFCYCLWHFVKISSPKSRTKRQLAQNSTHPPVSTAKSLTWTLITHGEYI